MFRFRPPEIVRSRSQARRGFRLAPASPKTRTGDETRDRQQAHEARSFAFDEKSRAEVVQNVRKLLKK